MIIVRLMSSLLLAEYKREEKRFLATASAANQVVSIERIVNPALDARFSSAYDYFEVQGYHSHQPVHRVYHGTAESNIDSIMRGNFLLDRVSQASGYPGQFGAGIYFSSTAGTARWYSSERASSKVLQCDIMPGRQLR